MKKTIFIMIALLLLALPASALEITNAYPIHVNNGNGFLSDSEDHNIFLSVNENTNSIEIVQYAPSVSSNTLIIGVEGAVLKSGFVASNGYIYFTSNRGVFKYNKKGITNPVYTNDTGIGGKITPITSDDTNVKRLRQEGNYIYYMSSNTVCKRFNLDTNLISTYDTFTLDYDTMVDYDVYNGDIYRVFGDSNGDFIITKNDDVYWIQHFYSPGTLAGGIQVMNDELIYVGVVDGSHKEYYTINSTSKIADWNTPDTTNMYSYGSWYIGYKESSCMGASGASSLEVVETADSGRTFGSSSSSSSEDSSSITNPLVDMDGDGEFTQDDAKEFSLTVGPVMWIFMLLIFITVAMGGRR